MTVMKKYLAEIVGTMVLVLMGCGAAVSLGCDNGAPATVVGTAMAFGLAVVAMAYTIGGISGCHINPAITLGCFLSGRMSGKDAINYVIYQCIGGVLGAAILYLLTSTAGLVGTGANDLQACGASTITPWGGLLAEVFFTFVFVLVVLGATAKTNGATNTSLAWQSAFRSSWFTWLVFVIQVPLSILLVASGQLCSREGLYNEYKPSDPR